EKGLITADGKLVSEQQLSELNSQLVLARADTAKAEARYEQIEGMINSGRTDGAVADSLGNAIITDLRGKYVRASQLEAEVSSKLGPSHLAAVNQRREMAELQKLIFQELQRIAQTYKSDL